MQIENIKRQDIKPFEKNPRLHSSEQVAFIRDSIMEFGFNNPVLIDENNIIIVGHGRVLALDDFHKENGNDFSVPCIRLEHLTEEQKKAYIVIDNKSYEMGSWDTELLNKLEEESDLLMSMLDDVVVDEPVVEPVVEPPKKVEIKEYKKYHFLVSFNASDIDNAFKFKELLKSFDNIEVEESGN